MAKVCISGYYGYGSVEHDLMLMSMISALRRRDESTEIVVFSAAPQKTEEDFGVIAVDRNQWDLLKKEMKEADLILCGGGYLLKESAEADLKYYLKLIRTAQRLNLPVFIYNQIFQEYHSARAKLMVSRVMKKVRKISVADAESAKVLQNMGIRRGRIHVIEDPLLALGELDPEWAVSDLPDETKKTAPGVKTEKSEKQPEKLTVKEPINYDGMEVEIEIRIVEKEEAEVSEETIALDDVPDIVADEQEEIAAVEEAPKAPKTTSHRPQNLGFIVPSFWKKPGEKFAAFILSPQEDFPASQVSAMADYMYENGYQVVFIPMHHPDDVVFGKAVLESMANPGYEVDGKLTPQSLVTAIKEVDFVFSSDIYAMILAAVCGKPFASLCCSERALDLVSELGLTPTSNLAEYDSEAFVRNFKAAVNDPAAIVAAIEENLPALQEKAAYTEEQLEIIFAQIARRKAREARLQAGESRRREKEPVVSAEIPAEIPEEISENAEADLPTEASEAEEGAETLEIAEETEIAEAEEEAEMEVSHRRSSRKSKGKGIGEIFSGILEKIKELFDSLLQKARSKSSRREDDAYEFEDDYALTEKEETEEAEEVLEDEEEFSEAAEEFSEEEEKI